MKIQPIVNNEESYQLLYSFILKNNPEWKKDFLLTYLILGISPIQQNDLSDYEYFKLLTKKQKALETIPSYDYLLVDRQIPVVSIKVIMRNQHIADLSFVTDIQHRHRGYATKALEMIENLLFQNADIFFTTINDMTTDCISSKMALKAGYVLQPEFGYFIKANSNLCLEEDVVKKKKVKKSQEQN